MMTHIDSSQKASEKPYTIPDWCGFKSNGMLELSDFSHAWHVFQFPKPQFE